MSHPSPSRQPDNWTFAYLAGMAIGAALACGSLYFQISRNDEGFSPGGFYIGMVLLGAMGAVAGILPVALVHLFLLIRWRLWWYHECRAHKVQNRR